MYAQTDIKLVDRMIGWGEQVDKSDFDLDGDYEALIEVGALAETHPAIADNPGAVEALRAQSEQLQTTKERLAAALAKIEELTGEPVDEFALVSTPGDVDYDPSDHTVDQVIADLDGKDEAFINAVMDKEEAGQARSTLLSHFGR
jgi:hypothetical protein